MTCYVPAGPKETGTGLLFVLSAVCTCHMCGLFSRAWCVCSPHRHTHDRKEGYVRIRSAEPEPPDIVGDTPFVTISLESIGQV